MNERSLSFIAIGLIIIIIASFAIYELGFIKSSTPSIPAPQPTLTPSAPFSLLWQRPIENFANSLAVDDGKVFTVDNLGNVNCFDSQNGKSIWNSSAREGFPSSVLEVSGGQVYVGFQERSVDCLDANNGQLLWAFQNEQIPNRIFKGAPQIIVKDDRLFAISDTISAHNATTGELLWQAISTVNSVGYMRPSNNTWTGGWVQGYPLNGDSFDGSSVYATAGNYSSMYLFKLNTDNGQVLWSSSVTWDATVLTFGLDFGNYAPQVLATVQGQVVMEKAENILSTSQPAVNQIFSLDSITGQELWSINVAANIYNPTVYNKLMLFSASNGYFYALNLTDGTTAWKTKVDTQNLFSLVPPNSIHFVPPTFQIDPQNQRLFWSFGVAPSEASGNYTATICSLDLANGNIMWTKQIEEPWVNAPTAGLDVNNGRLFLTENNALWIFNASTGNLLLIQQFDHYVSPPIAIGNETFVAADLWLFAYA